MEIEDGGEVGAPTGENTGRDRAGAVPKPLGREGGVEGTQRPEGCVSSASPPRQYPGQRSGGRREGRAMLRSGFIRLDIIIFK